MADIISRIKLEMQTHGIKTVRALAQKAGLDESKVGGWLRGAYKPSGNGLSALAKALGVSTDYLLTGKEPNTTPLNEADFFPAPLIGSAGGGLPVIHEFQEQEQVMLYKGIKAQCGPGKYASCWCIGDSMEPTIKDGSLVVYRDDPPKKITPKKIYVINIPEEDGATIKKVRVTKNGVDLIPINPDHEIQTYRKRQVQILGTVCGIAWQAI